MAVATAGYHSLGLKGPPLTAVNLTASPAPPKPVGTAVTLTATPTGGVNVDFRFRVGYVAGGVWTWSVLREWGAGRTCAWTPTVARTYTLQVYAREAGTTTTFLKSIGYTVTPPLTAVALAASPGSPQLANTAITLTATPTGGAVVQCLFRVGYTSGGAWTWTIIRGWGASRTCTWTPSAAQTYTVQVQAREAGTTTPLFVRSLSYTITPPLTAVGLAASPPSPQPVSTAITLTATPTGGAVVQYLFRVGYISGGAWTWTIIRGWGASPTCGWTPAVARTYSLQVSAREMGSTAAVYRTVSYTVTGP
jgi:hypothetical protein